MLDHNIWGWSDFTIIRSPGKASCQNLKFSKIYSYSNQSKPQAFLKPLKSKGDPAINASLYLSKIHYICIEKLNSKPRRKYPFFSPGPRRSEAVISSDQVKISSTSKSRDKSDFQLLSRASPMSLTKSDLITYPSATTSTHTYASSRP